MYLTRYGDFFGTHTRRFLNMGTCFCSILVFFWGAKGTNRAAELLGPAEPSGVVGEVRSCWGSHPAEPS